MIVHYIHVVYSRPKKTAKIGTNSLKAEFGIHLIHILWITYLVSKKKISLERISKKKIFLPNIKIGKNNLFPKLKIWFIYKKNKVIWFFDLSI